MEAYLNELQQVLGQLVVRQALDQAAKGKFPNHRIWEVTVQQLQSKFRFHQRPLLQQAVHLGGGQEGQEGQEGQDGQGTAQVLLLCESVNLLSVLQLVYILRAEEELRRTKRVRTETEKQEGSAGGCGVSGPGG